MQSQLSLQSGQTWARETWNRSGIFSDSLLCLKQFEEHTEEDLDPMLNTSFKGAFQFLQVLVRELEQGVSIINISSVVATILLEQHIVEMFVEVQESRSILFYGMSRLDKDAAQRRKAVSAAKAVIGSAAR